MDIASGILEVLNVLLCLKLKCQFIYVDRLLNTNLPISQLIIFHYFLLDIVLLCNTSVTSIITYFVNVMFLCYCVLPQ